jgi:hypothetical protein
MNSQWQMLFQSLSGFLARCDSTRFHFLFIGLISFNPCRVFSLVATSVRHNEQPMADVVSIPVGFSRSLRQYALSLSLYWLDKFQSLSGFLARCDLEGDIQNLMIFTVSIPVGFSRSLRLAKLGYILAIEKGFQSLSGFLARCDSEASDRENGRYLRFNPCRVFSLVATVAIDFETDYYGRFNPCRVFSLVATSTI